MDAVGTVCGDPDAEIDRAVRRRPGPRDRRRGPGARRPADRHPPPLYLRGTTTVAADTFKGKVVHTLIKRDIALHVAHTNADTAYPPGVSDALAERPRPARHGPLVPDPTDPAGRRGLGRICELDHPRPWPPSPPAPPPGSPPPRRASGWPATRRPSMRTVAVSGGSGDSLFDAVRAAGVDAFLTADLRHHPASEAVQHSPLGLVDAAHWSHRVALVRAGGGPARRAFRPPRMGPAGPCLEAGHRP